MIAYNAVSYTHLDVYKRQFVDYMNKDIDPANPIIQASCQTVKLYHQTLALVYTEIEEEETNEY